MTLIVFLEKNGHRISNERYTLETLLTRIKQSDEIELPKLVEKKIQNLQQVGNLASHASMERLSPREMWDDIRMSFKGLGKWIFQDELSLRPIDKETGEGDFITTEITKQEFLEHPYIDLMKLHYDKDGMLEASHFVPLDAFATTQLLRWKWQMKESHPSLNKMTDWIIEETLDSNLDKDYKTAIWKWTIALTNMIGGMNMERLVSDHETEQDFYESLSEKHRELVDKARSLAKASGESITNVIQLMAHKENMEMVYDMEKRKYLKEGGDPDLWDIHGFWAAQCGKPIPEIDDEKWEKYLASIGVEAEEDPEDEDEDDSDSAP